MKNNNLLEDAYTLHLKGEYEKAKILYENLLSTGLISFELLYLLGSLYLQMKYVNNAIDLLSRAVQINPKHIESLTNLGSAFRENNNFPSAQNCYEQAIAIDPTHVDAYFNYGNLLLDMKEPERALQYFDKALRYRPQYPEAYLNKANAWRIVGNTSSEKECLTQAISLNPQYSEAWHKLGLLYKNIGQFQEALRCYQQAILIDKSKPDFYISLGVVYQELGDIQRAIISYRQAIELQPDFYSAHHNIGVVLQQFRQFDQALNHYQIALNSFPNSYESTFNMAVCLLTIGNYALGWQEYEVRSKITNISKNFLRSFEAPLWLGDANLAGKTILLHAEQGLGDTLQFCRYAKLVAGLGARVLLEVQPALISVLKDIEGVDAMFSIGDPLPPIDYHCPLMSLPLAFKTTLETIPNQIPYIRAAAHKVAYWSNRLGPRRRLRIGLVWSGGFRPDQPEVWATNARRNISLDQIAKLKMEEVDFYSLQKGDPAEQELRNRQSEVWPENNFYNYANELIDFSDTAGLIENLDLVISVDTSTAHLAGALGKPVWILNRFDSCWRWLLDRDDSPWYPTARLYRQANMGDWDSVLEAVKADLGKMIK